VAKNSPKRKKANLYSIMFLLLIVGATKVFMVGLGTNKNGVIPKPGRENTRGAETVPETSYKYTK